MRVFNLRFGFTLISLLSPLPSYAFFDDYLPLSAAEIQQRVPMKHLVSLDPSKLIPRLKVGRQLIQLESNAEEDLVLSGVTTQQGKWSVKLNNIYAMFPTEAYQADLDNNGQQDLILLKPTAGNGLAPSQHISVLSFDTDGQVRLWQVEGYFARDQQGITDFLDLNGNGRAELVFMSYGGGYWQTVLYEAQNSQWTKIKGKFAGKTYPLLTRFTFKPNHKIVSPNKLKNNEPLNLANDKPLLSGYLKDYQWANVEQSEDISLMIQTDKKLIKCQPSSWYSLFRLVLDKPKQREIVSLAANSKTIQAVLQEAIAKRYPLKLYGQRSSEVCSPEEIWFDAK
ncbi:MAG: VCBS repeat-containing protein [Thiothrix sp.]|nr:MAG: VCBS repeat-containing protein [Thiothrix sp.]